MGHQHQMFNDPFASSMSSLEADIFSGAGGYHHFAPSPQWPGLDNNIPAAPAANNATSSGGSGSQRKMSHNAYERDRRKQLNEQYSSLRSLLPDDDHNKKMSIPTTVSRVIKYIPELQKEVDGLEKKKEELRRASCEQGLLTMRQNTAPVVSATCLDDREIMVQVSLVSTMAAALPMSKCIKVLENEGLRLINSSTSAFQNRTFYSLHLQRTQRTMSKEGQTFCNELENAVKQKAGLHLHH
ncbi:protein IRON-RELATED TRANSCRIPTION FACTOR 2-like [Hordeum vulgare subsp. vulgare]|uniref:protein IRON-RELATED TRANSCRIPTION FACTOR 2-like n=1 Tax=Hordeum vulgare subsp. vulgare TaxID=112509 RepID=UPI000296666D|nr:protein IRON-RELATED TRANSCRIPTION FACTOR 2-like [Hordeum vulgare subsp. vulgare]